MHMSYWKVENVICFVLMAHIVDYALVHSYLVVVDGVNVRNDVQLLHVTLTLPRGRHPHLVRIWVGCFGWCCLHFARPWKEELRSLFSWHFAYRYDGSCLSIHET
jgi:hypothetical protein